MTWSKSKSLMGLVLLGAACGEPGVGTEPDEEVEQESMLGATGDPDSAPFTVLRAEAEGRAAGRPRNGGVVISSFGASIAEQIAALSPDVRESYFAEKTTAENTAPDGLGTFQFFVGQHGRGAFYWHPSVGLHAVYGVILDEWERQGWEVGFGYPTANMVGFGTLLIQQFESLQYEQPGTGAVNCYRYIASFDSGSSVEPMVSCSPSI